MISHEYNDNSNLFKRMFCVLVDLRFVAVWKNSCSFCIWWTLNKCSQLSAHNTSDKSGAEQALSTQFWDQPQSAWKIIPKLSQRTILDKTIQVDARIVFSRLQCPKSCHDKKIVQKEWVYEGQNMQETQERAMHSFRTSNPFTMDSTKNNIKKAQKLLLNCCCRAHNPTPFPRPRSSQQACSLSEGILTWQGCPRDQSGVALPWSRPSHSGAVKWHDKYSNGCLPTASFL